jgi:hypothetical protein
MVGTLTLHTPVDCFSSAAYRSHILERWLIYRQTVQARHRVEIVKDYARRLPAYLLARCPICGEPVGEPVDTFSLNGFGWANPGDGRGWSPSLCPQTHLFRCPHVRIVTFYLNLRGRIPDDLFSDKRIQAGPGVPNLMLVPMAPEDARAVICELPIGRFDDEEPRHHYSAHFVTYFTESEESFVEVVRGWGLHHGMVEYSSVDYDLQAWAERGRLLWLDPADQELPLRKWGEAEFPFAGIEGDRNPYRVITRDGVAEPEPRGLARLFRRWRK